MRALSEKFMTEPDHVEIETFFVPVGRRTARVIDLDGQGLLYDEDLRIWMVLNSTALVIWRCLDGTGSVAEIADDLGTVYGTEKEAVRMHVLHVVRAFARQGLLEGIAPADGQHDHEETPVVPDPPHETQPLFHEVPPTA
jgi:hypothetical protein